MGHKKKDKPKLSKDGGTSNREENVCMCEEGASGLAFGSNGGGKEDGVVGVGGVGKGVEVPPAPRLSRQPDDWRPDWSTSGRRGVGQGGLGVADRVCVEAQVAALERSLLNQHEREEWSMLISDDTACFHLRPCLSACRI